MMKKQTRIWLLLWPAILLPFLGFAQAARPDSGSYLAQQAAREVYKQAIGLESHLYNGTEYINYDKSYMTGHQFFQSPKPLTGRINYDHATYSPVEMQYDIVYDQIVLTHPTSSLKLKLVNEKIHGFTLGGHTFIRLHKDSLVNGTGKTGFYDLLFEGPVRVLAKRIKTMQEQTSREGMTGQFDEANRFFLLRGNTLYPVRSKRDVYAVLPEKRKELQQFAAGQKLKFRKTREADLIRLVQHYATLSPGITETGTIPGKK